MTKSALDLYRKYFAERQFERQDLFEIVAGKFDCPKVLYPGSFVHITPSFVFPEVVYVDNDKQAKKFFSSEEVFAFIHERKAYQQAPQIKFHFANYRVGFEELPATFDLLISQYAGFVGMECKSYLKIGGLLLANNSHGDAGLAALDDDFQLIATFNIRKAQYSLSETKLEDYFIPKSTKPITKEYLIKLQKGVGYAKTANSYLFRKIQ
jgi:hypothetical protein